MLQTHFFCPLCSSANVFKNYPGLFKHIRNQHRDDSFFTIRCELSSLCGSRYTSFDSYRQHIYRCHHTLLDSFDNDNNLLSNVNDILNDSQESFSHSLFNNQSNLISDSESPIYDDNDDETDFLSINFDRISLSLTDQQLNLDKLSLFYTHFLLELREHHLLPQKIVQAISTNFCALFNLIIESIKMKTSSTVPSIVDLEATFAHISSIISSISKNEHTFLKQCQNFFGYRPPTEIRLGTNGRRAYYVPLKESISNMLRDGELFQSIINNVQSLAIRTAKDKDLILSNRQATSVKSNISRQNNTNALLLKLYIDGIGVTNPIGPKRDSHKFTCFYYLLDDLPDIIRSQVNSIGLHCLSYTRHLNDKNNRNILMNVLVEDMNRLQNEGITIPCLSSRVYFVFSSLCGDNLASNEVGGFQKNFNSGNFCRHCYISYEQRHIPLTDTSFVPRTRLKHDMNLHQVMLNNGRRAIQGVTDFSWFKDLIGFDPTESLPCDIMHDTAEGVCPLILTALFREVIQKRLLTYAQIEKRTQNFIYGFYDLSNKPPPVKQQHIANSSIIGSAGQKLCLFRLFPIIFYDLIDRLHLFPLYTILREILSYIYANPIRKSWLSYLDGLCKQFHSLMIEYLPDRVTPKVHFITEYPRSIEKHGLPVLNSCIRFEAKHLYFKQLANRTFNFKNPLLTLSKRHQLRYCLLNNSNSSSYSSSIKVRSSKLIELLELTLPLQRLLMDDANQNIDFIYECNSIYYHQINIRQKAIIIDYLAHTEEIPVFCQIYRIFKIKEKWIVIAEKLNTVAFNEKLWSYEVEFTGTLIKLDIEYCFNIIPHCFDTYVVEQSNYINILTRLTKQ